MNRLKWLFLSCIILALLVYGMAFFNVSAPRWVRFYAADFLCMPIVLYICLFVIRQWKGAPRLQISLSSILSLTTFYAIYFEVYLPPRSERYTGDIWDVVMYFLGSMLFYSFQNYPFRKSENLPGTHASQEFR